MAFSAVPAGQLQLLCETQQRSNAAGQPENLTSQNACHQQQLLQLNRNCIDRAVLTAYASGYHMWAAQRANNSGPSCGRTCCCCCCTSLSPLLPLTLTLRARLRLACGCCVCSSLSRCPGRTLPSCPYCDLPSRLQLLPTHPPSCTGHDPRSRCQPQT